MFCIYVHRLLVFYSQLKLQVADNSLISAWNVEHEGVDQQIESLIQKHTEGGYVCTACGYTNNAKKDLKRHVETHIETPGYPCNFCGKQFKTRNSLNTHLSTKHREERKQYYVQ